MKANLQRYMLALSLGMRLALAAANGAAQPTLESPPAVSSVPSSPATGSGGTARAAVDRGSESGWSGQVVKGSPLLCHGEMQVLVGAEGALGLRARGEALGYSSAARKRARSPSSPK